VSGTTRQAHWENVYRSKSEKEVSWFETSPAVSLDLIARLGVPPQAAIIDIGGGASRLVDHLLERGFSRVTVLDISETALAASRARLGSRAAGVQWLVADATKWEPRQTYDLWHDRAAFHFLTEAQDRDAYVERLRRAVVPGGHVIIGTFAPDGPARCSGLPVARHDAGSLAAALGPGFDLVETRRHEHVTPSGGVQRFQFSAFRRAPAPGVP
jgi:SAM-dependent methyltransferase